MIRYRRVTNSTSQRLPQTFLPSELTLNGSYGERRSKRYSILRNAPVLK